MADFGTYDVDCPICGRQLHIPIHCSGPSRPLTTVGQLHVTISPDMGYLEAHWLTHGPHDGMPLPIAA